MSVKAKLVRQAVKTTAKHSAHGTASKFARRPFRSVTLLALGATLGVAVGWLLGRSAGGGETLDPVARAPVPAGVASQAGNSGRPAAEPGAVS